jgi:hypothetical protein
MDVQQFMAGLRRSHTNMKGLQTALQKMHQVNPTAFIMPIFALSETNASQTM